MSLLGREAEPCLIEDHVLVYHDIHIGIPITRMHPSHPSRYSKTPAESRYRFPNIDGSLRQLHVECPHQIVIKVGS